MKLFIPLHDSFDYAEQVVAAMTPHVPCGDQEGFPEFVRSNLKRRKGEDLTLRLNLTSGYDRNHAARSFYEENAANYPGCVWIESHDELLAELRKLPLNQDYRQEGFSVIETLEQLKEALELS